jgi:hypothetical protein
MEAIMDERDADGVSDFCRRHNISRGFLYDAWRRGKGPRFMQAGDRRLISREAGADWRRELEAETATALRGTSSSQKQTAA